MVYACDRKPHTEYQEIPDIDIVYFVHVITLLVVWLPRPTLVFSKVDTVIAHSSRPLAYQKLQKAS